MKITENNSSARAVSDERLRPPLSGGDFLKSIGGLAAVAEVSAWAAIASAGWRGRGDEHSADAAAVSAMRKALNQLPICGKIVIGEGERDEAPMLYIGEIVGAGDEDFPAVDIAVDPLEGTTLAACNMPSALCVAAFAPAGTMLTAPDVYMNKIAVGGGVPAGAISLDNDIETNLAALAQARGVSVGDLDVCVLERERHQSLMERVYRAGARVTRIRDGDIAASIQVAAGGERAPDMYVGIGGAPEGVLAAAALKCLAGDFQGRLVLDSQEKIDRASAMFASRQSSGEAAAAQQHLKEPDSLLKLDDLVSDNAIITLSGVTDGLLLAGVQQGQQGCSVSTLVMDSQTRITHRICSQVMV